MRLIRPTRTLLAATAALLVAAPPAAAVLQPTARIGGRITPDRGKPGTPLKLTTVFSIDPNPGETPGTLNRAVLQFPKNGIVNGHLFPSCSPEVINRTRSFRDCPKGSQIGKGRLLGDVPNLELRNVPGRVTLFNGPGGRSITVHIYLTNPALISIAFKAPLKRVRGKYGYTMVNPVPEGLQNLIPPDTFGALRWLTATVGITRKIRGRTRGFIEAGTCPKSGRVPIAGTFYFNEDNASTSTEGFIRCRPL